MTDRSIFRQLGLDQVARPKECTTDQDGTLLAPAASMKLGMWYNMHVAFSLITRGNMGLFVALTPQGARELAADLCKLADLAERNGAEDAAAKLAAIAKGGPA